METSAKVILDSVSDEGNRLTTMEVVMHRFVLAEFNTHRMFSRNSASSRAIPVAKQIQRLEDNPALPVVWAAEQKGMQGGDEVLRPDLAEEVWQTAKRDAIVCADTLRHLGVHKSITNRLLEPFMWHTVIVSSTEWDNFWRQRCSPLAQPEIRVAAELMKAAYDASTPTQLATFQWHMPYITDRDLHDCEQSGEDPRYVSAARCARVSYLTHNGKRDVQEDAAMYHRLVSAEPPHASPLEHVAKPCLYCRDYDMNHVHSGNFQGWWQLRHDSLGF